ncbi:NUDIX hydrolase [Virgibacillus necropolis]|uniref:NUDIX domain-containing protein n=1 Tax=Virgibacillus necropolis TaxID=163877 RepID=UPI00384D24FD
MDNIKNKCGLQFLGFIKINETEIYQYQPVEGFFAVIRCKDKYLICFNKSRNQWELPAGRREKGETPKECAIRELYEETGQEVKDLTFKGLIKVRDNRNTFIKYNPVYFSTIRKLQPFKENEETTQIKLWDTNEDIGYFDKVDLKILDYV